MTPANASLRAGEFTFALPFGRAQPAERPAAFRSRAVISTGSCRTRSISDGCVIKGRSTAACIRRLSTGRRGRMYSIASRYRRSLGEHPARRSFLPREQALRRSRKQDGREPCFQGRTLLAILCVARRAIGTQARGWVDHAHPGCRDRRPRFARGRDLIWRVTQARDHGPSYQSQLPRRQCLGRAARTPTSRHATWEEYSKRHRPGHGQCDPDRDRPLRVHRR